MKKIMFSERFGLEQAVLAGTKTQTRRIMNLPMVADLNEIVDAEIVTHKKYGQMTELYAVDMEGRHTVCRVRSPYQVGDVLAIAQSYETLANSRYCSELGMMDTPTTFKKEFCGNGWGNKMFVKAAWMPYRIRVTRIKIERLQDISEEDAMREGVFKYDKPPLHHEADMFAPWAPYVRPYKMDSNNLVYRCTARYAFAYLIDKICGGGTWNRNPWVWVYEFERIK